MLETPLETDAGSSNAPGGFEVGVEGGWSGWVEEGFMRWGKRADRRRGSLRRTHAGVVLGGLSKRHFDTAKHRETSVNLPVSVVSCVVSFALLHQ